MVGFAEFISVACDDVNIIIVIILALLVKNTQKCPKTPLKAPSPSLACTHMGDMHAPDQWIPFSDGH